MVIILFFLPAVAFMLEFELRSKIRPHWKRYAVAVIVGLLWWFFMAMLIILRLGGSEAFLHETE